MYHDDDKKKKKHNYYKQGIGWVGEKKRSASSREARADAAMPCLEGNRRRWNYNVPKLLIESLVFIFYNLTPYQRTLRASVY